MRDKGPRRIAPERESARGFSVMCKWYFGLLMFGVAFTVAVAEALSRVIDEDRERRRQEREQPRVEREAEDTAATAWSHN